MEVEARSDRRVAGADDDKVVWTASQSRLLRESARFAIVGAASTFAFLGLYAALRTLMDPAWANLIALLATTIANTAANRRVTFGVRGRDGVARHHLQALLVFGVALGLSSGALALLHLADPTPSRVVEVSALLFANVLSTSVRFLALRTWIFRQRPESSRHQPTSTKRQGSSGLTRLAGKLDHS